MDKYLGNPNRETLAGRLSSLSPDEVGRLLQSHLSRDAALDPERLRSDVTIDQAEELEALLSHVTERRQERG